MKTGMTTSLLILYLLSSTISYPQNDKTPTAAWILPGITYQHTPHFKLSAQYGINSFQSVSVVYLQAFINTGSHMTLNPAYLFINSTNSRHYEHTLMNAVIFTFRLNKFIIEDRNLIWNRFRHNLAPIHFYRNRLRITRPFTWGSHQLKIYAYDEGSYLFNEGKWTRNRMAIGYSHDLTQWFNVDVSFAREHNIEGIKLNVLFIMCTLQFAHKKK